jgi:hypothetical protein
MTTTAPTTETGRFETPNASKYLQQLCKHFGHKVQVTFDDTTGTIVFAIGSAHLTAQPDALCVQITADDADKAQRARQIIDDHLQRFAFREEFSGMSWTRP